MPGDSSKPKTGPVKSPVKSEKRRAELRRAIPKRTFEFKSLIQRREFVLMSIVGIIFAILTSLVITWSHRAERIAVDEIMTETRVVRIDFSVPDERASEAARQRARDLAPRIYTLNQDMLTELRTELQGLPLALADQTDVNQINETLRNQFSITPDGLTAIQKFVQDGQVTERWSSWVDMLVNRRMHERPMLKGTDWQIDVVRPVRAEFQGSSVLELEPRNHDVIRIDAQGRVAEERVRQLVQSAGFTADVGNMIVARLMRNPRPVFEFDAGLTNASREEAANGVEPVIVEHKKNDIIYHRGDILTPQQLQVVVQEKQHYREHVGAGERLSQVLGMAGIVSLITIFLLSYLATFYPRVIRNPWRLTALCGLMLFMLVTASGVSMETPQFLELLGVSTTMMTAMLVVIAYDRRLAIAVTTAFAVLATLSLGQSIGFFVFLIAGSGAAIVRLYEVRHRNSIVSATTIAAGVSAAAAFALGVATVPLVEGAWTAIIVNSGWSAFACLGVGFVLLGILPTFERAFDITTGMTLVELRDPKQPLLRQLQERAPGTYNHSLQVASIAEAAADSIRADSLLTYVGALYHDIGKMNKPRYFIENQSGDENKHKKLSPAMSLLVIVGHVKDGVELAREHGLPRALHHFIESHHGTTLVEYFYHAAREQAGDEAERVEEIEYRYPGPKPRTREAAILMLSDAIESATRAMADPTPASIENLVRKLSRKRLLDGQFDDAPLTFNELRIVEDSIIKSMWSLYHGRIAYPKDDPEKHAEPTTSQSAIQAASDDARAARKARRSKAG